ncbi:NAD-dependent protein deacetylase of SIR2 family [Agromyces laixinhei]|uniref:NAD-dependent protein deacetylase of SIR2 family n=1 Tax=Agromyces laixinhei TaxID=2585717 RepID=UPI0011165383|nr:NAD-dependent protein deacetylase of SIR2 family [Agromyces laixinhei]
MNHPHEHQPLVDGTGSFDDALDWITTADRVLIGAGAGLSAAAGYDYGDRERFAQLFPALHRAGFNARYELIGYPLPPRLQWGFWAVHVDDIRLGDQPDPVYEDLRQIVGDRDHFVMSSNVDALFTRNGFDTDRVYTPQGDYALSQCLTPCTREVWDARPILRRALEGYDPETGATSEAAVPSCPNCGGPVTLNVFAGTWYINDHFQPQLAGLNNWLANATADGATTAIIEIGAGFNTPGVIRWPIDRITAHLPSARLIRINTDHPGVPAAVASRAASLTDGAADVLRRVATTERTPT